jgi:starch-binding outer membrane protein, SusD/RagB family
MRKISKYLCAFALGLLCVSCNDNFFDTIPGDRLTLDQTFSQATSTESFLANVYSYVPDEFSQRFTSGTAGPWTGGSSEAEYVWSFVESQKVNNGSLDPSASLIGKYWNEYYKGINKASIFMERIDKCLDMDPVLRPRRKAEARALRAYYYFNLLKIYGPVVLLGENSIPPDASFDAVQLPRNSVDECVDFISKQLDQASTDLPDSPNEGERGRITRPMALAFRSQVLLYAASPLFNGNTDYAMMKNTDGKQLISQEFSQTKWELARDAAKLFLDQFVPNQYFLNKIGVPGVNLNPYMSYRETVRGDNSNDTSKLNKEMIFFRISADDASFQYEMTPFHSGAPNNDYKGSGGKSVTQEMVDLYFTNNGLRIDDDPTYKSTGMSTKAYNDKFVSSQLFAPINTFNQWVAREPRFYADVTFNNSIWLKTDPSKIITTTFFNGNSGQKVGGNDYPVTGYIVRKGAPLGSWGADGRACILLRLAEIYLNYAEACNECGDFVEAIKYVNIIRQRAGVPEYGTGTDSNNLTRINYPVSKDEIRNRIRRERCIELSFENQRYFDVRRWKVADMAVGDGWVYPTYHLGGEGGEFHGLNVSQDPPSFFKTVVFEKRTFEKKHYLFPVPQSEININKKLVQTTGWETSTTAAN